MATGSNDVDSSPPLPTGSAQPSDDASTGEQRTLSIGRYRNIALGATIALCLIVLTGAAVRLTGSGLGCTNWPTCEGLNPVPALELHGMVEFVNRLVTGAVSVAVALAVLGSRRRTPYDRSLTKWSWGLVGGVVAQIIWGGVTTLSDLHPAVVGGHFLISMALIANAVMLVHKAGSPIPVRNRPTSLVARVAAGLWVWGGITLWSGVIVTGTGPHAGDPTAPRFGFELFDVVRVHGAIVWVFLIATIAFAITMARRPSVLGLDDPGRIGQLHRAVYWLLAATVAQGSIGYLQYFTGVPPLIVALHIVGAMATWISLVRFYLVASYSTND